MFSGVSALLFRSLREDALLLRYHMLRGGIVFFLMLNVVQANESMFNNASPGLELFRGLLMNNILLISLAGIGYFATPIAEEKEEETLGLLLMAGVSRLGILLGKSTSRLIITLVLGLIEVPFLLLAITLGGVTQHQIWCGFALVASFTIFVANLGLLFSVVCSTTASASRSMLIFLLVYFIIPPLLLPLWVSITSLGTTPSPVAQFLLTINNWIYETSPWFRIWSISATGYASTPLTLQVQSNLIAGAVCFILSWILFDRFARDLSQVSQPRQPWFFSPRTSRSRRCVGNPFLWKDFYFQAGGFKHLFFISILLAVGMAVYTVYCFGTWAGTSSIWDDSFLAPALAIMVMISTFHLATMAARYVNPEVRDHTLPILFLTPHPRSWILYSKLIGTMLGAAPSLILTFLLFWAEFHDESWDDDVVQICMILGLLILAYLQIVVLLSLFLKWGAVPAAVGVMFVGSFCWGLAQVMSPVRGPETVVLVIMEFLALNAVLHAAVAARIYVVAQK